MVKMSMADCIIEFEHLYHKMTDQKMSSPNTVQILKLEKRSELTEI